MIHPEFLLVLLGAALVPSAQGRRLAALAACAGGLAIASLRAGPVPPLPAGFVAVEAALLAAGAGLALVAALASVRDGRSAARIAGAAALAAGGIGLGRTGAPLLEAIPLHDALSALLAVTAIGLLLLLAGRLVPGRTASAESEAPPPVAGLAGIALGTLLAAAGPHAAFVFLGVMVAAWAGYLLRRTGGGRQLPVAPLLTLLLVPAWWLMATIAGPEGLGIASLANLPWSPAAERLLAPLMMLPAWALTGLWPLHRQEPAAFTAPVGALLLLRIAVPAVPDGLEHWRAVAMPVVVVGLWHAALTGRRSAAAAAFAWVGLLALEPTGELGGALLLTGALAGELSRRLVHRHGAGQMVAGTAAVLLVGSGALLAVEAGLHGEVVYTVLAVAGAIAALGRRLIPEPGNAGRPAHGSPQDSHRAPA